MDMKLRTTTPASELSFVGKITLVAAVVIMAFTLPIQFFASRPVSADQYDAQIEAIKKKAEGYREQANQLRGKADNLSNALAILGTEKAQIQAQIDLNQAEHDKLTKEIDDTTKRIAQNKETSGSLIVKSSLSDDVPLVVRLASSNNLADYIEGEANRISVRDTIVKKTEENQKLKTELEKKKEQVKQVLAEQNAQKQMLVKKENEQSALLAKTKSDEAAYQGLISQSNSEMQRLQEEQRRLNAQPFGGGSGLPAPTGGSGGYPYIGGWSGDFSPYVDPWGFYYQQCTSYVAWKVHDSGRTMPRWGSMYQPAHARYWPNFTSNTGYEPRTGAAAVMTQGTYGHVMYVEGVSPDKSTIYVSDYNLGFDGKYRSYPRSASGVIYVYF